ncbi:nuclear transport factor 2 family protein [Nocardia brasiliensis]|uniref:nuclear transport factor 2 family protein n=1 Tax=Nocardia brasiliensis TaxID=37326 RepID=UPI002457F0B0|nr:nuclear transport factor 2 family protein [Nocardia brasiliensis]
MTTNTSAAAVQAAQNYLDALCGNDLDSLIALFADDVTWEDPVGSEPVRGRAALRKIYAPVVGNFSAQLDTPIRGSHANRAAMAFTFEADLDGTRSRARAIDIITVNDNGRITGLQAYWSIGDVEALPTSQ